MCMEDIRLGRRLASAGLVVSVVAGTPATICGPDPNRTRVCLSGDGVGLFYATFDGMAATGTSGFALTQTTPQAVFTVEEFGKVVTGPVTVAVSAGTHPLAVVLSSLEAQ